MSDRPSIDPDWTPTGSDVIPPSSGEKSDGHKANQRPPAQHVNWFWNTVWLWIEWIKNGMWTRSSLSDKSPVVGTTDRDGRVRNYAGPEGFWMGPTVQQTYEALEVFDIGPSSPDTATGTGLVVIVGANTNIKGTEIASENAPVYQFDILDAATGEGCGLYRVRGHNNAPDLCSVMEARIDMSAVGANGGGVWFGLTWITLNSVPTTGSIFVGLLKNDSDTNWQAAAVDGSTITTDDTGVPPVASTFQTLRVEYHGANTPVGVDNSTAPVVRCFIDGTLVSELTDSNVPAAANSSLRLVCGAGAQSPGPVGDLAVRCGPIHYAYNEVLDGAIPS